MTSTFSDRLHDVTEGLSVRQMALRADIEYGRLIRQHNGDHPWSIDVVVALCHQFNIRVADALLDVGWIDDEMHSRMSIPSSLRAYSDDDLLEEMSRRLRASMEDGIAQV